MCFAVYVTLPLEGFTDITCRILIYLSNITGIIPKFTKSTVLRNTFGYLQDEWNRTINELPIIPLFREHTHKLVAYKVDQNDKDYIFDSSGFIIIDSNHTSSKTGSGFEDITLYLHKDGKYTNIGKPKCTEHLLHKTVDGIIDSEDKLEVYICANTTWADIDMDKPDCHTLWLKGYDKLLWDQYTNEKNMPFSIIPITNKIHPHIKFVFHTSVDKIIYYDLFKTILINVYDYIKNAINDFDITDVEECINIKEIYDNNTTEMNKYILNLLYLMQGTDVGTDTLYYKDIIINDEEKDKLLNIIKKDIDIINQVMEIGSNT